MKSLDVDDGDGVETLTVAAGYLDGRIPILLLLLWLDPLCMPYFSPSKTLFPAFPSQKP